MRIRIPAPKFAPLLQNYKNILVSMELIEESPGDFRYFKQKMTETSVVNKLTPKFPNLRFALAKASPPLLCGL